MKQRPIGTICLLVALAPAAAQAAIDLDSGDFLTWSSAPAATAPLTVYCRFSADTANTVGHLAVVREGTNANDGSFSLNHNASGQLRAWAAEASSFAIATLASPTITTSAWSHGFGVFTSATSRNVYLGSSTASNATSLTPAGLNSFVVGNTNGLQFFGQVAEVCVWGVALSTTERDAITNGARPCAVRPSDVVFYLSAGASTTAEIGGAPSVTGTPTVVTHPPVVYVTRNPQHPMIGGFSND